MRRRPGAIAALPDLLELVARELRAGRNLHDAVRAGAGDRIAAASGIEEVDAAVRSGHRLADALERWAVGLGHPDADLIRAVLVVATDTGGEMAATVERAAATLRERAALHDELRALTAQVRVSAVLLAVAPPAFLSLVAMTDPAALGLALASTPGRAALLLGLALDAAGFWWMRRLVAGVAR